MKPIKTTKPIAKTIKTFLHIVECSKKTPIQCQNDKLPLEKCNFQRIQRLTEVKTTLLHQCCTLFHLITIELITNKNSSYKTNKFDRTVAEVLKTLTVDLYCLWPHAHELLSNILFLSEMIPFVLILVVVVFVLDLFCVHPIHNTCHFTPFFFFSAHCGITFGKDHIPGICECLFVLFRPTNCCLFCSIQIDKM